MSSNAIGTLAELVRYVEASNGFLPVSRREQVERVLQNFRAQPDAYVHCIAILNGSHGPVSPAVQHFAVLTLQKFSLPPNTFLLTDAQRGELFSFVRSSLTNEVVLEQHALVHAFAKTLCNFGRLAWPESLGGFMPAIQDWLARPASVITGLTVLSVFLADCASSADDLPRSRMRALRGPVMHVLPMLLDQLFGIIARAHEKLQLGEAGLSLAKQDEYERRLRLAFGCLDALVAWLALDAALAPDHASALLAYCLSDVALVRLRALRVVTALLERPYLPAELGDWLRAVFDTLRACLEGLVARHALSAQAIDEAMAARVAAKAAETMDPHAAGAAALEAAEEAEAQALAAQEADSELYDSALDVLGAFVRQHFSRCYEAGVDLDGWLGTLISFTGAVPRAALFLRVLDVWCDVLDLLIAEQTVTRVLAGAHEARYGAMVDGLIGFCVEQTLCSIDSPLLRTLTHRGTFSESPELSLTLVHERVGVALGLAAQLDAASALRHIYPLLRRTAELVCDASNPLAGHVLNAAARDAHALCGYLCATAQALALDIDRLGVATQTLLADVLELGQTLVRTAAWQVDGILALTLAGVLRLLAATVPWLSAAIGVLFASSAAEDASLVRHCEACTALYSDVMLTPELADTPAQPAAAELCLALCRTARLRPALPVVPERALATLAAVAATLMCTRREHWRCVARAAAYGACMLGIDCDMSEALAQALGPALGIADTAAHTVAAATSVAGDDEEAQAALMRLECSCIVLTELLEAAAEIGPNVRASCVALVACVLDGLLQALLDCSFRSHHDCAVRCADAMVGLALALVAHGRDGLLPMAAREAVLSTFVQAAGARADAGAGVRGGRGRVDFTVCALRALSQFMGDSSAELAPLIGEALALALDHCSLLVGFDESATLRNTSESAGRKAFYALLADVLRLQWNLVHTLGGDRAPVTRVLGFLLAGACDPDYGLARRVHDSLAELNACRGLFRTPAFAGAMRWDYARALLRALIDRTHEPLEDVLVSSLYAIVEPDMHSFTEQVLPHMIASTEGLDDATRADLVVGLAASGLADAACFGEAVRDLASSMRCALRFRL